ncbi:polysaccharide deacetylase family protein [Noviherbaspirillum cavernae]|uniref:polysaccharide deacetylase family protein n=1 Tax=Noviherbaspirillum cavernae TaxID=2320862 RepID=UPI001314E239|nr:polysaccharide deacetylase family protein [Noviherbaspirillum cavernae]
MKSLAKDRDLNNGIPILLYHRIDDSSVSTATPPLVFRRHLEMLAERGWRSLSAEEFAMAATRKGSMPQRSFVITFDDGYESVASAALAVLKEFDFKAICFLSTRFPRDPMHNPAQSANNANAHAYLSWEQARMLQSSGVIDCQSHSHSHRDFRNCSLAEIRHDLATSVDILSHELNLPANHFRHVAWPWGLSTPEWRAIARETGFHFQYTVARQSFLPDGALDEIPRTCFDATAFKNFQRQLWLQSGQLAPVWNAAYPFGRKLWQLKSMFG